MMKEFGVKLECYYKEGDEGCEYSINKESYPFNHCDISHVEMVEDLIDMGVDRKIYVAKESEHIFEPKHFDLAGFTRDDGISTVAQYDEEKKAFINGNFRILKIKLRFLMNLMIIYGKY